MGDRVVRLRVIDTIAYRDAWTHRYPEVSTRGEGVMAIVDPADHALKAAAGPMMLREIETAARP